MGEIGFATHRDEIPASLRFGGATIELTTAGLGLRNGTYDVDDAIPGGVGLTRDEIAVRVDPGTHILLRGRGLVLTGTTAASVPWASVTFAGGLATWAGPMRTLPWRLRDDGAISVSAPAEPGDWMVDLTSTWRSACLHGDGTAYGRIKVNG